MWLYSDYRFRTMIRHPLAQIVFVIFLIKSLDIWWHAGPHDEIGALFLFAFPGVIVLAFWAWRTYWFCRGVVRFIRAKLAK